MATVRALKRTMVERGTSVQTLKSKIAYLQSMFSDAVESGLLHSNPFANKTRLLRAAVPDVVGALSPSVQRAELADGVWHRLRVGPLPSWHAAKQFCARLANSGGTTGCFPVRERR